MKNFFNIASVATIACIMAFAGSSCDNDDQKATPDSEPKVLLTANKTEIPANGIDEVDFTVTADRKEVTSDGASVCYEFEDSGSCLPTTDGKILFRSDVPGKYVFKATYKNITSNAVEITVTDK